MRVSAATLVSGIEEHADFGSYDLSASETPVMQLPLPPVMDFGRQEALGLGVNLLGAITSGIMTYALYRALSKDPSIWWQIVFGLGAISSGVTAVTFLYQGAESVT
jgi:hypothetical protein